MLVRRSLMALKRCPYSTLLGTAARLSVRPPPSDGVEELRTTVYKAPEHPRKGEPFTYDKVRRLSEWHARKAQLFNLPARYVHPADLNYQLPTRGTKAVCEVAFVGRSNVGKSSLIEALLGHKGLVRTSKTPGCTKIMNFFAFTKNDHNFAYFVDMPGYGFARAAKAQQQAWKRIMFDYLLARDQLWLRRVFVLIDVRRGIQQADLDAMVMLKEPNIIFQVVLTKKDLVLEAEVRQRALDIFEAMHAFRKQNMAFFPFIHAVSAHTGEGLDELKLEIAQVFYDGMREE